MAEVETAIQTLLAACRAKMATERTVLAELLAQAPTRAVDHMAKSRHISKQYGKLAKLYENEARLYERLSMRELLPEPAEEEEAPAPMTVNRFVEGVMSSPHFNGARYAD